MLLAILAAPCSIASASLPALHQPACVQILSASGIMSAVMSGTAQNPERMNTAPLALAAVPRHHRPAATRPHGRALLSQADLPPPSIEVKGAWFRIWGPEGSSGLVLGVLWGLCWNPHACYRPAGTPELSCETSPCCGTLQAIASNCWNTHACRCA